MPAWITSLLRDEVAVPMPSAASSTTTSRPACASRRVIARPTTPAPITTHSTLSIRGPGQGIDRSGSGAIDAACGLANAENSRPVAKAARYVVEAAFADSVGVSEALIIQRQ